MLRAKKARKDQWRRQEGMKRCRKGEGEGHCFEGKEGQEEKEEKDVAVVARCVPTDEARESEYSVA